MMFHRAFQLAVMFAVLSQLPSMASAGDGAAFDAITYRAYAHHRSARFYLRTKNAGLAAFELQAMTEQWEKVRKQFTDDPPDIYANDGEWKPTLKEIAGDIATALKASNEGQIAPARDALRRVHRTLANLRRRNNIRTYTDCVDEMNVAMSTLYKFRRQPPDFGSETEMKHFESQVSAVTALYRQCRDEAPDSHRKHPEFNRMFDGAIESLGRIDLAVKAKNLEAIINILREVNSFDRMIFLRFG